MRRRGPEHSPEMARHKGPGGMIQRTPVFDLSQETGSKINPLPLGPDASEADVREYLLKFSPEPDDESRSMEHPKRR